jgi:hypothetical protein
MKWSRLGVLTCASLLIGLAYLRWIRPWQLHWGATAEEAGRTMPGDELIPEPTVRATRAITIEAQPGEIWPWLVQMGGYTRAGWYSYDRFDNAGVRSADRIIPELQDLRVGDVMLTSPGAGFTVREIDPGKSIVLEIEHNGSRITTVPVLEPIPGDGTRLIFRLRARFRPIHYPFAALFDLGDFFFMRKELLEIKKRVEARG